MLIVQFMAFSFKQTISFIYLLIIIIVVTCTTPSLLSHDEECLALFQFKNTFVVADGIQKFESWRKITGNGSDCCLWDGVTCSREGHVIGLDLSESSLYGPINSSSSLFTLVHLQTLNLSMNDFGESQLPVEISRLKQLRSLDLSSSGFSGQIPNEISHLVQLFQLDLSWNPLKLQSPSLEYLLQNMTRLQELHLSGVDIGSSIPRFLSNFSSLRSIKLGSCGLQDKFPSAIFHLPQLKYLKMSYNSDLTGSLPEFRNNTLLESLNLFSTGFSGIIPESIGNLNHLGLFAIGRCFFSGRIPGSLSNLTQLTLLSLDDNELTGLIPSLVSLSKLDYLDLSNNSFDNGRILNSLSKLTRLNVLYLDAVNISDKIPPSFANLTNLRNFTMRDNLISGRIPLSFLNLTQLILVDFKGNQLEGPISSAFSKLKNLEYLNLEDNNFSGRVYLDTFVGLGKLESLYLSKITFVETKNYTEDTLPELKYLQLSSCNLKKFPAFLGFQKKMIGIFLQSNKIEGLVPEWMWNNSQETLQMLGLQYNFITGFDQQLHSLPWNRLEYLDISSNQLGGRLLVPPKTMVVYDVSYNNQIGAIPSLLCEVTSLQLLDISCNNMTGTIPLCLGNLSNSLLLLNLRQNRFHGPMMNTFTHGCLLKRLDLSENRFTGQVSKSLANCTSLEVLSLGDNFFHDVFPLWLGTLNELQILILRSNKFYGEVHSPTIGSSLFLMLRIIDLSNNGFSGQLPEMYFQSWMALKSVYVGNSVIVTLSHGFTEVYQNSIILTNKGVKRDYEMVLKYFTAIDLSSNTFEGPIPRSLQDLQGLESLNLSNNHLTGRVLPSLGNLKNLESLDLSHNDLSGDIPHQLLQLGFLAIFNVSFNHLHGPIPQGKQFNTFDNNSYMGNPGLCGEPLSKKCRKSKASALEPTSIEPESLLPSERIDWIIILMGVGSGLIIGIVIGNLLYARYSDWLIERLGLRKDMWIRPLSNKRTR